MVGFFASYKLTNRAHQIELQTAPVWERGIIEDDYGVRPDEMEWFCGAMEPSAEVRTEKLKLDLPFKMTPIKQGQCLAQMLADGEIDVLFTA